MWPLATMLCGCCLLPPCPEWPELVQPWRVLDLQQLALLPGWRR
jgi:hypothetical protein